MPPRLHDPAQGRPQPVACNPLKAKKKYEDTHRPTSHGEHPHAGSGAPPEQLIFTGKERHDGTLFVTQIEVPFAPHDHRLAKVTDPSLGPR
mmetsp:Transcript_42982/g.111435  ORF Transcript_42982/g.111435 Transcript_42982/m.111435 type:complete len:91 (-) Transcript_42982:101-373(-)